MTQEEMFEQLKKVFPHIDENGDFLPDVFCSKGIQINQPYINHRIGDDEICLDGHFTLNQLKILVKYLEEIK